MPLFGQLISQLGKSSGNVQRLRTALFWNITQRIVVIPDRRVGKNLSVPSSRGTAVAQWLRCCATNLTVADSIPDGVIGIFH